jgi:hypothetical protein
VRVYLSSLYPPPRFLPNAGTCNYSNSGNLPEILRSKNGGTVPDLIQSSAIVVGRWERKRVCLRGDLFSKSTVQRLIHTYQERNR